MKNFYVLTLFPEMIEGVLSHSIIGRAVKDGVINVECVNIRDFSTDKHRHVDDYPYGGGAGMVMQPQHRGKGEGLEGHIYESPRETL